MLSNRPIINSAITLAILIAIPITDFWHHGTITGVSLLLVFLLACWTWVRLTIIGRRRAKEAEFEAAMYRRAQGRLMLERLKRITEQDQGTGELRVSVILFALAAVFAVLVFFQMCVGGVK